MAFCLRCDQKLTTKLLGAWQPGQGFLCSNCASPGPGKVIISLLFRDGNYKESGVIILPCDQAGFKALLESMAIGKHAIDDIPVSRPPEFVCLECGHKFYSVHAAEAAAFGDGCPNCNGSDIEVT